MNSIVLLFLFWLCDTKFNFFKKETLNYQIQNLDGVNTDLLTVDHRQNYHRYQLDGGNLNLIHTTPIGF